MKRVLGRLFRKKNTSAETHTNTEVDSQPNAITTFSSSSRVRLARLKMWQKLLLGILAVLCVVAIVFVVRQQQGPPPTFTTLPTEEQYYDSQLKKLLANPPKDTDTAEMKAKYYTGLSHVYAEKKKYPEAIEALQQGVAISPASVSYFDYLDLARYHFETGNKDQAIVAIDEALSVMPEDNPELGYSKAEHAERIQELRKVYAE